MRADPIQLVLARLDGVKVKSERQWSARCPSHDDRVASLSIKSCQDGTVLLHCHAGCDKEAILEAAALEIKDLFPTGTNRNGPRKIVAKPFPQDLLALVGVTGQGLLICGQVGKEIQTGYAIGHDPAWINRLRPADELAEIAAISRAGSKASPACQSLRVMMSDREKTAIDCIRILGLLALSSLFSLFRSPDRYSQG